MIVSVRRAALALLGLLLAAACQGEQPDLPPPSPALWEVTGEDGAKAYLFGTVHSLPRGAEWRTAVLDRALAASDRLAVEVDLVREGGNVSQIFEDLAHTPGLPPLSRRLPAPAAEALAKAMAAKGLTDADFRDMESWAAAIALSQAYQDKSDGEGADAGLIRAAKGKAILELEGAERQLRMFDALPEAEQRDLLAEVAKEALSGDDKGDARLRAWLTGDVDALVKETGEGMLADPELREALLTARNRAWAERVGAEIGREGTLFVAVGAAHLVGPDGLAALLEAQGFTVKRLQ